MEACGNRCKLLIIAIVIITLLIRLPTCQTDISCRNEAGEPVDWFAVYKLPKHLSEAVTSGLEYMYLDAAVETWQLSKFTVNTSEGALGHTLNQLYLGHAYTSNGTAYTMYNDGAPNTEYQRRFGHTKGVLLFDHSQGFWLSHSIPRFPDFPEKGFLYPPSGRPNGQTALCVTYKYSQFPVIARQLIYLIPRVYNCSVPPSFLNDLADLAQLCEGSLFPPPSTGKNMESLLSANGEQFLSFAKSEHFVHDIYADWVAQELQTDLLAETWQLEGRALPSNCSLAHHAMNVQRVALPGPALFQSKHDHSKWCVSRRWEDRWSCVGDLNRQRSQMSRAGGLLCSQNPIMYKAFRQAVSWYEPC